MSLFVAEVASQKYSLQASFRGSDAALMSLNLVSLCSSLIANHMAKHVPDMLKAGAFYDLTAKTAKHSHSDHIFILIGIRILLQCFLQAWFVIFVSEILAEQ
ncbi:hypothetical protein TUM4261_07090 [Shewanella sp. c952]|nr:hypothetical protein TUM4261_07090 [Shewanella sp. c952]